MRNCLLSADGKQYDTAKEFVSYTFEKKEGSRFLGLQYQRGNSDEQFMMIKLVPKTDITVFNQTISEQKDGKEGDREILRQFQRKVNIVSEEDMISVILDDSVRYHMNIVDKTYLERIITTFDTVETIRASGAAQALNILCDPVRQFTKIEINPVELTLLVAERFTTKKAEGRCLVM